MKHAHIINLNDIGKQLHFMYEKLWRHIQFSIHLQQNDLKHRDRNVKKLNGYHGEYSRTATYAAHMAITQWIPRNDILPSATFRARNFSVSSSKMTGNDILSTTSHSATFNGVIWNTTCIPQSTTVLMKHFSILTLLQHTIGITLNNASDKRAILDP